MHLFHRLRIDVAIHQHFRISERELASVEYRIMHTHHLSVCETPHPDCRGVQIPRQESTLQPAIGVRRVCNQWVLPRKSSISASGLDLCRDAVAHKKSTPSTTIIRARRRDWRLAETSDGVETALPLHPFALPVCLGGGGTVSTGGSAASSVSSMLGCGVRVHVPQVILEMERDTLFPIRQQ
mmetsp:Transcript_29603/g.60753  ORF Transcript_29603/g.60753 Transcript_29603/m.60753 type:complete len:182 (+) Transcript_29603:244-789(+)